MKDKDKELEYIHQKLIYDFIDDNKYELFVYLIIIIITFPLTTVFVSKLFGALTDSVSKYNPEIVLSKKKEKGIFREINYQIRNKTILGQAYYLMLVLLVISAISWTQNEVEKIIFPKYITFLNYTLRTGTLNSRNENFEEN